MGSIVGFIIELIVVVLLGFTVAYCVILDRRLQRLRSDEKSMRQTVVDLGLATERAERTIDGLRNILSECDKTLGERLRVAQETSAELEEGIKSGDEVLERIASIVSSARRTTPEPVAEPSVLEPRVSEPRVLEPSVNVSGTLAAAEAFAQRARQRITDAAA